MGNKGQQQQGLPYVLLNAEIDENCWLPTVGLWHCNTPNQNHHGATNNVNVLDIFCVEPNALQWLVWSLSMRVSQLVQKARQLASFRFF